MKKLLTFFVILSMFVGAVGPAASVVHAQQSEAERRKQLERELAEVEQEIFLQRQILHGKRQETQTIQRDIDILNAEIAQAQLSIRAKNLAIGKLTGEMEEKEQTIQALSDKIGREKTSLAQLVRRRSEIDEFSLAEVMLGSDSISTFFEDLDNVSSVKVALHGSLDQIRAMQDELEEQKKSLDTRRRSEADAKYEIEQQKSVVEKKEDEKQVLLSASKDEEKTYEQIIAEKQKKAQEIRTALFQLRDAGPIQFQDALRFAEAASAKTGVRTAFILGILKQESNLGQNVGQCYLRDPDTGGGVGKNTGTYFNNVMHPTRDVPVFLTVAKDLGFDAYNQVVSCPQSIGYGGAMGPSQFIPSTWAMYSGRVASALGVSVANPWEPEHAFMATGLFLADLGAGAGGYSAEREAAARYYAGGNWQTYGLGYAASVLRHAEEIQTNMIDPLKNI